MTQSNEQGGFCFCGCGQRTKLATNTNTQRGYVKGQPMKYVYGHNARVVNVRKLVQARAAQR